jgi:DNA-binding winged helix-turn-helix (wHTH) protein/Tol biopolymer transport system component
MPQPPKFPLIYRFSVFQLNVQAGELHKDGVKLKLQEQPFKVLCLLLQHPGEVVSREEIRNRLWPADTFVDFDHGLNAAIKRLRDVLGESADAPVFIETLARRGYRFIAPVEGGELPSGIGVESAPGEGKSSFLLRWVAIVSLSGLGIGVLAWALWRPRPKEAVEHRLTANSSENTVSGAAISPDGKYLTYTDTTGTYVKQTRTGETHAVPLPADFQARVDDWFPDGSHLLVSRQQPSGSESLWNISVFGGSPRQLADKASRGSVSPDGEHIAFCRVEWAPGYPGAREVWVMRSDGTEQVKVAGDNTSWVTQLTWSPDGDRIAYIRFSEYSNSVEVNEWRNARTEIIFSNSRMAPALHWLPGGRLIYGLWDGDDQQGPGLWVVPLQQSRKIGGLPKRVTRGKSWMTQVTVSQDGKVLTFLRETIVPSVYVAALAPDGKHLLTNKRLTLDENENKVFSWTPDSKAVLFNSNRNGPQEIFKQAIDQPLAERLVSSSEQLSQPRVTPDGSEIVYLSAPASHGPDTPISIFAIPIAGGSPRLVLRDVRILNMQCARLPSTTCLYTRLQGDKTDTFETFRFDVRSGKSSDPPQIDRVGDWILSPDGSQRAILAGNHGGIIRFRSTVTGESHEVIVKGWKGLDSADWFSNGKGFLATWEIYERNSALLYLTLDGKATVLLESSNPEMGWALPSPDGRFGAIQSFIHSKNVWQIENF